MNDTASDLLGTDLKRRLPPVRRMLDDPQVPLIERRIDEEWAYNKICPSVRGWNPWSGCVFFGARSATADWLRHPEQSLRKLNEGDLLVREALFAAHDYLHVWATRMIQTLAPKWRLGYGPITKDNVEALTFLVLVTEAVATVGLDYWYLSTFDLNSELTTGTRIRNLTLDYREEYLAEYRHWYPGLEVQDPEFFSWLCRLYTLGVAEGFDKRALKESPLTFEWLQKELRYGQRQREYARSWLQHLAGEPLYRSRADLLAPVDCSASWQVEVVEQLGRSLWRMVKDDEADPTPSAPDAAAWASPEGRPFDPRFDNLAALEDPQRELLARGIVPGTWVYLFAQAASSLDFAACSGSLLPCLDAVRDSGSSRLLLELLRHYSKVEEGDPGPKDMFFYA